MTSNVLVDEVMEQLEYLVRHAASECIPGAIVIEE